MQCHCCSTELDDSDTCPGFPCAVKQPSSGRHKLPLWFCILAPTEFPWHFPLPVVGPNCSLWKATGCHGFPFSWSLSEDHQKYSSLRVLATSCLTFYLDQPPNPSDPLHPLFPLIPIPEEHSSIFLLLLLVRSPREPMDREAHVLLALELPPFGIWSVGYGKIVRNAQWLKWFYSFCPTFFFKNHTLWS